MKKRKLKLSQTTAKRAKGLLGRRLRTAVLALLFLTCMAVIIGYSYYRGMIGRIGHEVGYHFPEYTLAPKEIPGLSVDVELADAPAIDAALKSWAENGADPMQDRFVLNILLCGVDSDDGEARGGRSDAMMLVSINRWKRSIITAKSIKERLIRSSL